jgi:putative two-component system response regulator
MAMNMLKNEGYHMFYAKDASMALKLIKEHGFDLILMDIMMPKINGFEVCKIIKEDEKTQKIPIIFLSGHDSSEDIQKAYEVGGIDYIIKPFIEIELKTKVAVQVELAKLRKGLR